MIKTAITGFLGLILGFSTLFFLPTSSCQEDVYHEFVIIEGKVTTLEPETGKVFTPSRQQLIFQRVDCKKCLSIAFTDAEGYYDLMVGKGKYRLIVREDFIEGGSSLDPKQPEIIDAKNKVTRNVFDVKLIRHKNSLDMDIPSQK